ncbi:hypothetical protein PR048_025478 [Dryococelus australis]|uniref:Uncharacterized protein n=1 Tax=Dryococelus australis TaxID=614101 RepID=A0ABQ9GRI2_9NEOP|nr:hypothetical protein PR048_025478 [Dryococelus australis]
MGKITMKFLMPGHNLTAQRQRFWGYRVMNCCDIIGNSDMEASITNRKLDVQGQKVSWRETREFSVRKATPGCIFMKTSIEGKAVQINIKVKQSVDILSVLLIASMNFVYHTGQMENQCLSQSLTI